MNKVNTKAKRNEVVVTFQHSGEEWATSTDRVPVFSIVRRVNNPNYNPEVEHDEEGFREPETIEETVTHTMPGKPNAGLALAYLRLARRTSSDEAMSWLIETATGEEAYDDLIEELSGVGSEGPTVLEGIVRKIQTIAMGGLEAPKD